MEQANVRGNNAKGFWGFLSRSLGFTVDGKVLQEASRKGARRKRGNGSKEESRATEGNSGTGKNLKRVRSSVGKGERGISEICDQIGNTADELVKQLKQ